ncbi:YceI family protein [Flavobacterium frigoris]|uniref:Uncharacterized protein n=1 Tax=Flavobacterium frigoris (strain PS1) TaxID=1086011 RepID=H7FUK0_FLAFP|nr:YceI family protein [Flavobacterium frigoris]EIA07947.1 hypothetical protein HJ01_02815 [Flavobacterium frigoris PS1]
MKNLKLIALGMILFTAVGCKDSKKSTEDKTAESQTTEGTYTVINDSTKVSFTAYKTTDKAAVGGIFKEITLTDTEEGKTAFEALNGTKFSIPVSSLFTNDATGTRDPKILKFFFGVMKNTELISGEFKVVGENTCSIDVTLNGKTANIPLQVTNNSDTSLSFDGVMNLENWDGLAAVASINKACEALHTGADGVSKTWSEVAVHADVLLNKN